MPRKESKTNDKSNKKCACDTVHAGNNPSWYTREGLNGMVGANFSALATVNDMTLGSTKIKTNTGIQFHTLVGCPSDDHGSFMKMMTQMYAEIREKNAGAANYNPRILGAYVHDLMTLRALFVFACRAVAAARSSQTGNADSPYYLTGVACQFKHGLLANNLANTTNSLRLIGKDLSAFPVPNISMFAREEFLYGRIFADSKTNKASMMAFVPVQWITRVNVGSNGVYDYGVTKYSMPASIDTLIERMRKMLRDMSGDPVISILRGDLIKAFGYSGVDLSDYVDRPLTIEYNETVLAQIENMNVTYYPVNISERSTIPGEVIVEPNITTAIGIPQRCDDTEWMINFHSGLIPDNGTLLSITRNMAYLTQMDESVDAYVNSGDIVEDIVYITGIDPVNQSVKYSALSTAIRDVNSTTQSTAEAALRTIAHIASIVDGFPWVWTGSGSERTPNAFIWDVDQWATVTKLQLSQMHEQCIRSLFYCRAPRVDGMIKPGKL